MVSIHVSNDIAVRNLPTHIEKHLLKALTVPNTEFFKFKRMGIWAAADFKYYKKNPDGSIVIPRGFKTRLTDFLDKVKESYNLTEDLVSIDATLGKSMVSLRDYQKEIVDKVVDKKPSEGIIVASTGAGKTIMALEIAHRLAKTTTILVHNTVLLEQFEGEAKMLYGLKASICGNGRKEIGKLTIATFSSLMADKELLDRLAARTSILIVDEAQGAVSKERSRILKHFKPSHLMGLTATPERSDSLTPAISILFGHNLAEFHGTLLKPTVEVVRTDLDIPMSANYAEMVESMVENENRNKLIAGLAVAEALSGRKVLVLTKRIKHYENLSKFVPDFSGVYCIDSSDEGRNTLLSDFKQFKKSFSILFGTTALLAIGTDIPVLDTLIIACDIRSSVLTQQSAGRILRLFAGKKDPKILDLMDNKNPIFRNQFYDRKKVYEKNNWTVQI